MLLAVVTPFDSCIFFDWLLQRFEVQTAVTDSKPEREALEELIGAQALSADLKPAIMACLSGAESRRWTIAELSVVLIISGCTAQSPPCRAPWAS